MSITDVVLDSSYGAFDSKKFAKLDDRSYPTFRTSPEVQKQFLVDADDFEDRDSCLMSIKTGVRFETISPLFPTYATDGTFKGISYLTPVGLVAMPLQNSPWFDVIEGSNLVLTDHKVYIAVDDPAFSWSDHVGLSDARAIQNFSLDVPSKCIIAIPTCLVADPRTSVPSVQAVILYNLSNSKVLELCLFYKNDLNQFIAAIPKIANIRRTGTTAYIRVTGEQFFLNDMMGTSEEFSLWYMSHPELLERNTLQIDEPSEEYRLLCPQFKSSGIIVGDNTGTTKLSIYNLPEYNSLSIDTNVNASRDIYLSSSCRGSFVLTDAANFNIKSDGNLQRIAINSANSLKLQCNNCDSIGLNGVSDALVTADSLKLCEISYTNLKNSVISNSGTVLLEYMHENSQASVQDTELSNMDKLKCFETTMHACKLSNIDNCDCSVGTFSSVEMRSMHRISLSGIEMKDCILYADDNTDISLNSFERRPRGALRIVTSTGNITFSGTREFKNFRSLTFTLRRELGGSGVFLGRSPLNLDLQSSCSDEITLHQMTYLDAPSMLILAYWAREGRSLHAMLFILAFVGLNIKLSKGTILNLDLAVAPMPLDVGAQKRISLDNLVDYDGVEFDTFTTDVTGLASELEKECSELEKERDEKYALFARPIMQSISDMLSNINLGKITVTVPKAK